ncbi:hypothetical protein VPHD51_0155 [Vibrio phage D51]
MLHNKMYLQPHGHKMDMDIGEVFIALVSVDGDFGTYKYYLRVPKSPFNDEEHIDGMIFQHDRRQNAFHLLRKVLEDYGHSSNLESYQFMKFIAGSKEYGDITKYTMF